MCLYVPEYSQTSILRAQYYTRPLLYDDYFPKVGTPNYFYVLALLNAVLVLQKYAELRWRHIINNNVLTVWWSQLVTGDSWISVNII
jgi:hypothetical protein